MLEHVCVCACMHQSERDPRIGLQQSYTFKVIYMLVKRKETEVCMSVCRETQGLAYDRDISRVIYMLVKTKAAR